MIRPRILLRESTERCVSGNAEGLSARDNELEAILIKFAEQKIEIVEIADQTQIQLDIVVNKNEHVADTTVLHERDYLPDADKKIIALQVEVKDLSSFLATYKNKLHRIYDF